MSIITKKKWDSLLKKAKAGDSDAQFAVGYYFEEGTTSKKGVRIVEADLNQARKYYTYSAKQGNILAQNALGVMLSSDPSNKKDVRTAVKWIKKSIMQGSSTAAHNLACIYRDKGKLRKSYIWYKNAANMGDTDSYLELALCYYFGIGVPQSTKKAVLSLKSVVNSKPELTCQRSKENSRYWLAIISLREDSPTANRVSNARKLLEEANHDDDHEQANELLNIIGKSSLHIA